MKERQRLEYDPDFLSRHMAKVQAHESKRKPVNDPEWHNKSIQLRLCSADGEFESQAHEAFQRDPHCEQCLEPIDNHGQGVTQVCGTACFGVAGLRRWFRGCGRYFCDHCRPVVNHSCGDVARIRHVILSENSFFQVYLLAYDGRRDVGGFIAASAGDACRIAAVVLRLPVDKLTAVPISWSWGQTLA